MTPVGDEEVNDLLRRGHRDEVIRLLEDDAVLPDAKRERVRAFIDWASYGNIKAKWIANRIDGRVLQPFVWEVAEPYLDGSDFRPFDEFSWLFQICGLDEEMLLLIERARAFTSDPDIREFVEYWDEENRDH